MLAPGAPFSVNMPLVQYTATANRFSRIIRMIKSTMVRRDQDVELRLYKYLVDKLVCEEKLKRCGLSNIEQEEIK